jgi:hypothetical protein
MANRERNTPLNGDIYYAGGVLAQPRKVYARILKSIKTDAPAACRADSATLRSALVFLLFKAARSRTALGDSLQRKETFYLPYPHGPRNVYL